MVVGTLRVVLFLPENGTLKDKRHVLKGLLEKLRRDFAVSAAEVDRQDVWNSAIVGVAFGAAVQLVFARRLTRPRPV